MTRQDTLTADQQQIEYWRDRAYLAEDLLRRNGIVLPAPLPEQLTPDTLDPFAPAAAPWWDGVSAGTITIGTSAKDTLLVAPGYVEWTDDEIERVADRVAEVLRARGQEG